MKKVRSSQAAILVLNWVKHSFSQKVSLTDQSPVRPAAADDFETDLLSRPGT